MATLIKSTDLKNKYLETLRYVKEGYRLVIIRNGRPMAALVSIEDLEFLERMRPTETKK